MSAAPKVNRLRLGEAEPLSDLRCADKVVDVYLSAHGCIRP